MLSKTYRFRPEGKGLKTNYILEDENNEIVYEAKVLKQPLIGAASIEFINHVTGNSEEHKVGQTITTETSQGLGFYTTKSHFKYDGQKIWDYLHSKGVRTDSSPLGGKLGMTYSVMLGDYEIATIATASLGGGLSFLTSAVNLDVTASEENLDLAFLTAFAIARTDQTFYS